MSRTARKRKRYNGIDGGKTKFCATSPRLRRRRIIDGPLAQRLEQRTHKLLKRQVRLPFASTLFSVKYQQIQSLALKTGARPDGR
jgi:hypothetical protein